MLPKDAAERLGIAKPTLRKWAHEFAPWLSADAGQPGAGQDRRYSARDIALLQRIQQLLAQRYSYAQVRERIGVQYTDHQQSEGATVAERSALAPGEQVVVLNEQPEVEALRQLLTMQGTTLDAQRATLEAQAQLIAQLQQQGADERARLQEELEHTRTDLVGRLAEMRGQVERLPRWLRALLGLGV